MAAALGLASWQGQWPQPAAAQAAYREVSPAQLKAMLERKDFALVNVHVPYEGEIQRTDAFVPYTEAQAGIARLVQSKTAKVVVYCKTGRMSAIAAMALARAGYTDVLDLEGGMDAWEQAGLPLLRR